jgi:hypothetical protein
MSKVKYVIRLRSNDRFVRVYQSGKQWVARSWADTATQFTSYDEALATRQRFNLDGSTLYQTFDNGKTIAPVTGV